MTKKEGDLNPKSEQLPVIRLIFGVDDNGLLTVQENFPDGVEDTRLSGIFQERIRFETTLSEYKEKLADELNAIEVDLQPSIEASEELNYFRLLLLKLKSLLRYFSRKRE